MATALPKITLLLAIDAARIAQLARSLPSWIAHRPPMCDWPVVVLCDCLGSLSHVDHWESQIRHWFRDWRAHVSLHGWNWGKGLPQRERMLTAFVHGARLVDTPWHLKLDTDVIAEPCEAWIKPEWFSGNPAFIASPWGYTKPGRWLSELDDWAIATKKSWPNSHPLKRWFPDRIDADRFSYPRIASWCFYGRTDWVREQAERCGSQSRLDRLPVPSHDTFLWYCALRTGSEFLRVRMRQHGWKYVSRLGMPP